jgi:predicted alpha/beta-fold hydrolase
VHGFVNADDYYTRSSSIHYLSNIRVPTLLLSAIDDPFLPSAVLDEVRGVARGNPQLTIEFPRRGGHVGFVSGRNPFRPFYYGEWRVSEFLAGQLAAYRPRAGALRSEESRGIVRHGIVQSNTLQLNQ